MKLSVTPQGQSLISITDFVGKRLIVGSMVIAPFEDKLQVGVVTAIHSAAGTLTAELHATTFAQPISHLYLFPTTQVLGIKAEDVPPDIRSTLIARSTQLLVQTR